MQTERTAVRCGNSQMRLLQAGLSVAPQVVGVWSLPDASFHSWRREVVEWPRLEEQTEEGEPVQGVRHHLVHLEQLAWGPSLLTMAMRVVPLVTR